MNRLEFIKSLGWGALATATPTTLLSFKTVNHLPNKKLRFGIVADVHKDLMPDADDRLRKFIHRAQDTDTDFIIQLGDFCMAETSNKDFLGIWNQFKNPKFHVLGNHDMDRHYKAQILDFWEMPKTYYSYDFAGYHFVVLDANFLFEKGKYTDYKNANFYVDDALRTFVNPEQIAWLKEDLEATDLPTIVFSHQSLWHPVWGVKNRAEIQQILEVHSQKVICCINGHNHIDYHYEKNGIDYIEINSMSYNWVSSKYKSKDRFNEKLYHQYPNLEHLAGYQESLFAFATIHPSGKFVLEGVRGSWMSPSPYEMGMVDENPETALTPHISNYKLKF